MALARIDVPQDLLKALERVTGAEPAPDATLLVAHYLYTLAQSFGLSESVDEDPLNRAQPLEPVRHVIETSLPEIARTNADAITDRISALLVALSADPASRKTLNARGVSSSDFLLAGQLYWAIEAGGHRDLPVRPSSAGAIACPDCGTDFAQMKWMDRVGHKFDRKATGQAFRIQGARLSALMAVELVRFNGTSTTVSAEFCSSGNRTELVIGDAAPLVSSDISDAGMDTGSALLAEHDVQLGREARALGPEALSRYETWVSDLGSLHHAYALLGEGADVLFEQDASDEEVAEVPHTGDGVWPGDVPEYSDPEMLAAVMDAVARHFQSNLDQAMYVLALDGEWDSLSTLVAYFIYCEKGHELKALRAELLVERRIVLLAERALAAVRWCAENPEDDAGISRELERTAWLVAECNRLSGQASQLRNLKSRRQEKLSEAQDRISDAARRKDLSRSAAALGDGSILGAWAHFVEAPRAGSDNYDPVDATKYFADLMLSTPLFDPDERRLLRYRLLKQQEAHLNEAGRELEALRVRGRIEELDDQDPVLELRYLEENTRGASVGEDGD